MLVTFRVLQTNTYYVYWAPSPSVTQNDPSVLNTIQSVQRYSNKFI